jgi:hypothetical protein
MDLSDAMHAAVPGTSLLLGGSAHVSQQPGK